MASANHDANHVALSIRIQDPVSAAATDGAEVSSARRNVYLNKANKFIQLAIWQLGKEFIFKYLSGLKKTQAINTWSSSGTTLATDYHYWIECQYDTGPVILTFHGSKMELDANVNPNYGNAFTIDAGKIYGYLAGTILNAGTGKLFYIQNDTRAQAGDTADISIDALWYDPLIDIAASFHFEDKGEIQYAQANLQRWKIIFDILRGG